METLEKSRVCRLCGKHSGISINIFDKNDNHNKKINTILPILVHEMDLLPKHMCHRCSYKLEEFHKFYIDCLKTDTALKSQLSWMRKDTPKKTIGVPMVQIKNVKIKSEPREVDPILESVGLVEFPVTGVENGYPDCIMYTSFAKTPSCRCFCDKTDPTRKTFSKDCTHPHLDLRQSSDFTFRLNAASEPKEPDILWNKRRNLFGPSSNPMSLNQKIISSNPTLVENSPPKMRNLRPRKRSVDYVGTKKKTSGSDSPEESLKSIESISNPVITDDLIVIKNEVFEEPPRILRPRKKFKIESKEDCSKSVKEYRKKLINTNNKLNRKKIVAKEVELEIKRENENIDSVDKENMERLDLRIKTENENASSVSRQSSRIFKKRQDRHKATKKVILSGKFIKTDSLKTNKDKLNIKTNRLNSKQVGHHVSKSEYLRKQKLKVGKMQMKGKVQFSPKNLRSKDLHLRSGKVLESHRTKHFKRDYRFGKNLLEKLSENTKKAKFLNPEVKHLCEQCNFSFANKELFRLHACYSN